MKPVRTLVFGTSEFAIPALKRLVGSKGFEVVGVVSQPDKPVGRKQRITPPPVKVEAGKLGLNLFQPEKLSKTVEEILEKTRPELIVVADYGQFIPGKILDYPKYKCLNLHGSLLPKLRGAVPIPIAILQGLKETGVSIPIMTKEMDAGAIVAQVKEEIREDDTAGSLKERLAGVAADLMMETLPDWVGGKIEPREQDESAVTFCYQSDISKKKSEIDWNKPAIEIERAVRAFNTWPAAWTTWKGKRIKVWESGVYEGTDARKVEPGKVAFTSDRRLIVGTGDGPLEIMSLQIEGKSQMNVKSFLNGYQDIEGSWLGTQ